MKNRQPRPMKRMTAEADQMRESDRLFFERFPWRQHRIRRLSKAELAQYEEATGTTLLIPSQANALFVIIKNLAPGVRLRIHTLGPANETGDDAPEAMVAALWNRKAASNPFLRKQEAHIQKAMRLPGGPLHKGGNA